MKLKIVNEELSKDEMRGVRFLFPPVAMPVDQQGRVCKIEPDAHPAIHYAALVFVEDSRDVALLEFSQRIMDALEGYAHRHDSLINVEILFSRESNGELRVTIGRTAGLTSMEVIRESCRHIHEKLSVKYLGKYGYETHDFEPQERG